MKILEDMILERGIAVNEDILKVDIPALVQAELPGQLCKPSG